MLNQDNSDLTLWLIEAKKLQKQSQSNSLNHSLPVLRRLIKTQVIVGVTLPELRQKTNIIQRKHLLNMLAIENGARDWGQFKKKIVSAPVGSIRPYSVELREAGYPVLWFANNQEAKSYVSEHGGKVVQVDEQAVVVPEANA